MSSLLCHKTDNLNIKHILSAKHYKIIDFQQANSVLTPAILNNQFIYYHNNKINTIGLLDGKAINYEINLENIKIINGEIIANENYIIVTLFSGEIYVYEKKNKGNWKKYKHNRMILSKPVIEEDKIYFIDIAAGLICITLSNNTLKEFLPTNRNSEILISLAPPVILNEEIIYTATFGQLFFLDKNTLKLKQKITLDGKSYENTHHPHLLVNDLLYLTTSSSIYCINTFTKEIVWKCSMDSNNPLVIYNNYIVATNGYLVCYINEKTGKIEKQFRFPKIISGLITYKDKLLLCDITNELYIMFDGKFAIQKFPVKEDSRQFFVKNKEDLFLLFVNNLGDFNLFQIDVN